MTNHEKTVERSKGNSGQQSAAGKYADNIIKSLQLEIPFFRPEHNPTIFADLAEDSDKTTKLVAGLVQSGKSAVICGLCVYIVKVLRRPVVVVLRNYTADYKQLASKFRKGGPFHHYRIPVVSAARALSLEYPAVVVSIEHHAQLTRVVSATAEPNARKPYLIVDEADALCYKVGFDKRITQLRQIKSASQQYIAVTATTFDMLFEETELKNRNIYKLPISENYKGLDHPSFTISELPNGFAFNHVHTDPTDTSKVELSNDLKGFYDKLLALPRFANDHPVISLHRTHVKKNEHAAISRALLAQYPTLTTIVYNGEGIRVCTPLTLPTKIGRCGSKEEKGGRYYKSCTIGDILQTLKDHKTPPSHIVIISGRIIGRGLNIVSNDYKWHLTHQLLRISNTATCSDVMQSCRLFGIYTDDIPVTLYCTEKDSENLQRTQKLQNRLFEGAAAEDGIADMPSLCWRIKVFRDYIPERRLTKKGKRPKFNEVGSEEQQYDNSPPIPTERRKQLLKDIESDDVRGQVLRHILTEGGKMRIRDFRDSCVELFDTSYTTIVKKMGDMLVREGHSIDVHPDYHRVS